MKKNRYHTIITADFLSAVIKIPEADRAKWVLQFALDLADDDEKTAQTDYAKEVIGYTRKRSMRKVEAGKAGAKKRWEKERGNKDLDGSAIANHCLGIANSEGEVKKEKDKKEKKKPEYSEEFEFFWKAYPKRKGKKSGKAEAFSEWSKLNGTAPPVEELVSILKKQFPTGEDDYAVDACRWLKKRRWEDEVSTDGQTKPPYDYSRY